LVGGGVSSWLVVVWAVVGVVMVSAVGWLVVVV
jgi:hypothetical protein